MNKNNLIDSIDNIFSSFYTHFILRDFFSFILPGGIFLFSCFFVNKEWIRSISHIQSYIKISSNIYIVILFFSLSYVVGYALHWFGYFMRFVKMDIHENETRQESYKTLIMMNSESTPPDVKVTFERLTVTKQMCGNMALSLSLTFLITIIKFILQSIKCPFDIFLAISITFFIVLIFFLFKGNRESCERQKNFFYAFKELYKD